MQNEKRLNKSKEEILADMQHQQKVAHIKEIARAVYPLLENVDSIYDAQTSVNALSGFIAAEIEKSVAKIKLNELEIDLSKEEDSKIKTSIVAIMDLMKDESAQELSETLERLGTTLQQFIINKHMKEPMSTIKIDDLVAK